MKSSNAFEQSSNFSNAAQKLTTKNYNPLEAITEVWCHNFETELDKITQLLDKFPFVAMVILLCLHILTSLVGY